MHNGCRFPTECLPPRASGIMWSILMLSWVPQCLQLEPKILSISLGKIRYIPACFFLARLAFSYAVALPLFAFFQFAAAALPSSGWAAYHLRTLAARFLRDFSTSLWYCFRLFSSTRSLLVFCQIATFSMLQSLQIV